MQLLMSFLKAPPAQGAAPAWDALDNAQRNEIVTMLARLIANAAIARSEIGRGGESRDE